MFFDATAVAKAGKKGLPDGMKVDGTGNLFATGPGGVLVFDPDGKHLGTFDTGEATANCGFGDDGSTLYITADMYLAPRPHDDEGEAPGRLRGMTAPQTATVWTVGHSTRPIDEFLGLLAGPRRSAWWRRAAVPRVEAPPAVHGEALVDSLGRRRRRLPSITRPRRPARPAVPGSPNTAWRVEAFNALRGPHGAPPSSSPPSTTCNRPPARPGRPSCASEAVPWRCHRRLIADALIARGWTVLDVMGPKKVEPHGLTEFARLNGSVVTYPSEPLFGPTPDPRETPT